MMEFEPGDMVLFTYGVFEIASVHLEGPRPIVKYTDGTHTSIRSLTKDIEGGDVSLRKREPQVTMDATQLVADMKKLEAHDGDVVLISIKETIPMRQHQAFRRIAEEKAREAGWADRGIMLLVCSAGAVELSRASTKRIDALEQRLQQLEGRVEMCAIAL